MNIRKSTPADLPRMLEIYAYAREQMRLGGNPNQWRGNRPSEAVLAQDIEQGHSYVIESSGRICGAFAFIPGEDPTYRVIEGGHWLDDSPYGTIHRIASDGSEKGVLAACLTFCKAQISHLRADTHEDNRIMRHLLEKHGFRYCGVIYVDDGTPRLAFECVGRD